MIPTVNPSHGACGMSRTAMESLARELGLPVEEVEQACRQETRAIGADARIKNFVPVLVTSRVRSELRRRHA